MTASTSTIHPRKSPSRRVLLFSGQSVNKHILYLWKTVFYQKFYFSPPPTMSNSSCHFFYVGPHYSLLHMASIWGNTPVWLQTLKGFLRSVASVTSFHSSLLGNQPSFVRCSQIRTHSPPGKRLFFQS